MTVFTAIFNNYDPLKEPLVITPGWEYICFTDRPIKSKHWQIKVVPTDFPRTMSKTIKILPHRLGITGNSIYIDGSFVINCDLNEFYAKHTGSISFSRNPFRSCVYEEIHACIRNKRDTITSLTTHKKRLKEMKVPVNNGMAASGVIMRSGEDWIPFCEAWMAEYLKGCCRDQVAWAAANYHHPGVVSWFEFDYRDSSELIFIPHNTRLSKQKATIQHWKSKGVNL